MKTPSHTLLLDEVHVWRVHLPQATRNLTQFKEVLSPDELARANRFRFQVDFEHFTAARAALRFILSSYLERKAAELIFDYGPQGKPFLKENPLDLRFNLAHSHELMLCALSRSRELGVDVEHFRNDIDFEGIARSFFAPQEIATLQKTPIHLKKQAFFTCWTRIEAYVKACGQGLSLPLDRFTVPISAGDPLHLHSDDAPHELAPWRLEPLPVDAGYAAALVVAAGHCTLVFRDWRFGNWQDDTNLSSS